MSHEVVESEVYGTIPVLFNLIAEHDFAAARAMLATLDDDMLDKLVDRYQNRVLGFIFKDMYENDTYDNQDYLDFGFELISVKRTLTTPNKYGQPPIYNALQTPENDLTIILIKTLPVEQLAIPDNFGVTPIMYDAQLGISHFAYTKYLLAKDISKLDPIMVDNNGDLPIAYYIRNGRTDLWELYCEKFGRRFPYSHRNSTGETLLHILAAQDYFYQNIFEYIAPQLNAQTNEGHTPLMYSIMFNNIYSFEFLIDQPGIDFTVQNNNDNNALMVACNFGRADMINTLLRFDVDIFAQNGAGYTALDLLVMSTIKELGDLWVKTIFPLPVELNNMIVRLSLEATPVIQTLYNLGAQWQQFTKPYLFWFLPAHRAPVEYITLAPIDLSTAVNLFDTDAPAEVFFIHGRTLDTSVIYYTSRAVIQQCANMRSQWQKVTNRELLFVKLGHFYISQVQFRHILAQLHYTDPIIYKTETIRLAYEKETRVPAQASRHRIPVICNLQRVV